MEMTLRQVNGFLDADSEVERGQDLTALWVARVAQADEKGYLKAVRGLSPAATATEPSSTPRTE